MCGTTVGASSLQLNVSAPSHVCIELSDSEAMRFQILQVSIGARLSAMPVESRLPFEHISRNDW